jgi:hypothetical protein
MDVNDSSYSQLFNREALDDLENQAVKFINARRPERPWFGDRLTMITGFEKTAREIEFALTILNMPFERSITKKGSHGEAYIGDGMIKQEIPANDFHHFVIEGKDALAELALKGVKFRGSDRMIRQAFKSSPHL